MICKKLISRVSLSASLVDILDPARGRTTASSSPNGLMAKAVDQLDSFVPEDGSVLASPICAVAPEYLFLDTTE